MPRGLLVVGLAACTVGLAAGATLQPRLDSARPTLSAVPASAGNSNTLVASTSPLPAVRGGASGGVDIALIAYFAFWYLGNFYYNIANKMALKAAGGKTGFPMTIGVLQLGVGVLYALYLWVAPDARSPPKITKDDIVKMLPVGFCSMGAHCFSVFALSAGAVSFGQIVKAAEPAFAAVISTMLYGKSISKAKWLCLIPVIGGVILASVKELDFAWAALFAACLANVMAAFKGAENKKLMDTAGLKDRLGSVGNQFAVTSILSFLFGLPLMIAKEGHKWGEFVTLCQTNSAVFTNLITSGLYFYLYNELATLTIKKTNAVTASVANTAKRVIVIIGVALVLRESLEPIKLLGCAIGIGGVMLYSVIDSLVQVALALGLIMAGTDCIDCGTAALDFGITDKKAFSKASARQPVNGHEAS